MIILEECYFALSNSSLSGKDRFYSYNLNNTPEDVMAIFGKLELKQKIFQLFLEIITLSKIRLIQDLWVNQKRFVYEDSW